MARISLDPPRSYWLASRFSRRRYQAMLDPVAAMAHNAQVGRSCGIFQMQVDRWRQLDQRLKDLAVMAAAGKIGCSWCTDFGFWEAATAHQVPAEKIRAVPGWWDSDLFTELERLVLGYAEAMTATPPAVTDELVAQLREQLSEAQLASSPRSSRWKPPLPHQRCAWPDRAGLQGPVRDPGGPVMTTSPASAADSFQYYRDLLFAVAYRIRAREHGQAQAALRPIIGAAKVARFLLGISDRSYMGIERGDLTVETVAINGSTGLLVTGHGQVIAAATAVVADGRVTAIQLGGNPDKLRAISAGRQLAM